MSLPLRNEALGEELELVQQAWDESSDHQRLNWVLKSDVPKIGAQLTAHMPWIFLPESTKEMLTAVWMEAKA